MKILFLTTVLPSGRYGGGEIWSQNVVEALRAAGATVTVVGYDRRGVGASEGEVAAANRTVETARNPIAALQWGFAALLRSEPYTVQKWTGAQYRMTIRQILAEQNPNLAIIDHAGMAWALSELSCLPFVHLSHQAESNLYAMHATSNFRNRVIYRREERLLRQTEARLARNATEIWTISNDDADYFRELRGATVRALPVAGRSDWEVASKRRENPDVALLGSWTWKSNREGLVWFLESVVPLLPSEWQIEVAGKYVAKNLPCHGNVRFLGVVPDAFAFLRSAKRIAVPSFSSVGVPIKLLDAIAAGPPVVTTSAAVARIGTDLPNVVAADAAQSFARALIHAQGAETEGKLWTRKRQKEFRDTVAEALTLLQGKRSAGR